MSDHNLKPVLIFIFLFFLGTSHAAESTCYGTPSNGYLENGVKLPSSGKNFVSYSTAAALLGRTYVHSEVKKIVLAAYKYLESEQPGKVFKYAETGFKEGGQFKPHKTHRNGLSVDFMTPVLDKKGKSVHLPTTALNKWGYYIEFDAVGNYKNLHIDYEALAAHIVALDKTAKTNGTGLRRVIFDPKLQPYLFKTRYAAYLKKYIQFSKQRAWVRHDEHYHVDFRVKCNKL